MAFLTLVTSCNKDYRTTGHDIVIICFNLSRNEFIVDHYIWGSYFNNLMSFQLFVATLLGGVWRIIMLGQSIQLCNISSISNCKHSGINYPKHPQVYLIKNARCDLFGNNSYVPKGKILSNRLSDFGLFSKLTHLKIKQMFWQCHISPKTFGQMLKTT